MVAEETGISLSSIQAYANNTVTRFDADKLAILCEYLGCEIGDLLVLDEVV
ncbi:MAG: helix-turn-helix transcriptional regulator [Chloroflexi bacterium]|nr:XRE family transcriptional regulator [Chloroflexota bacterium]NOG64984.1 helix-turn-helix transcriptional regulator [Chloroflexota bacterium]